jgi:hypothetical protein
MVGVKFQPRRYRARIGEAYEWREVAMSAESGMCNRDERRRDPQGPLG